MNQRTKERWTTIGKSAALATVLVIVGNALGIL